MTACAPPPKRGLYPEKIYRFGATGGSRLETPKMLVITPEFVSKNCFFVDFVINTVCFCGFSPEFMKISAYFGIIIVFFCGLHLRIRGNLHVV